MTTVSLEPSCLCTVSNPGTNEVQDANGAITAVTDVQNYTYKVVKIGSQCWMAENMRSTQYSNPSGMTTLTEFPSSGYTSGTAYYGYPNSESQNVETYGLLYNWKAAMGGSTEERAQGICPDGWHVPTSDEIYDMRRSAGALYGAAGKLAGGTSGTWTLSDVTAAPGNYAYSERNSSGFGILPAGYHELYNLNEGFHENALIWTSKQINPNDNANALNLAYNGGTAIISGQYQTSCLSVRCVRNGLVVTTSEASNIGDNSATLNATITNPENKQITAKGFQWKLTNSSDDFTSHTVDVNSAFTLTIDTLSSGSNYVCRAFVSTADGTFYGKNVYFETTGGSEATFACGDALKDNDYDNNSITYATVDINGRCWMAENLRSTKYASNMSGVPQQLSLGNNSASASIYYPGGSAENVATYGLLYNKSAAYGGGNTSGDIQGICPEGWHVPSKTEFETAISNSVQSLNNKLAGCYSAGQYSLGTKACYWTSTQGSENPYVVEIFVYGYISYNTNHDPEEAMSVRCVKDE